MAKLNMKIELDPGPWNEPEFADYRICGEPVSGNVIVNSEEYVNCRGLILSLGWRTEGRGNTDTKTVWEEKLHAGPIEMGQTRFPFSAPLPASGPMSYAGRYINIVWFLKARIDLAWRKDPVAEKIIYAVLPEPAESAAS